MNFLNAILLGGAAASLAPLLIQLLNRSRVKTLPWGAMHLLETAILNNPRRIQWSSLPLLLIRCLLPMLFALALARPVLTHLKLPGAQAERSLLLMLDDSFSMDATASVEAPNVSLLEQAKQELRTLARRASSAELSVWTTGAQPADPSLKSSFQSQRIEAAITAVPGGNASNQPVRSMLYGLQQLKSMSNPNRQLILASDFQASDWHLASSNLPAQLANSDFAAVKELLNAENAEYQLLLMPILPRQPSGNLSVTNISENLSAIRMGESHTVAVRVTNHGRQTVSDVRLIFSVNGQELSSRSLSLPAGSGERVEFACEFTQLGWHTTAVCVEDPSAIRSDDCAYSILCVTQPPAVWLVDQTGGQPAFSGASRYLQLALAPFTAGDSQTNPFRVRVIASQQLTAEDLKRIDVLVLAGIARLEDREAEAIEQFVASGGCLILFAHDSLDTSWANHRWSEQQQLLPMRFAAIHTSPVDQPTRLGSESLDVETLGHLSVPYSGLEQIELLKWMELIPHGGQPEEESTVFLKLADGQPLLVGRKHKEGFVVQCAISCADDWSNLPLRPIFVPLMRSLADILNDRAILHRTLSPGEPIELRAKSLVKKPVEKPVEPGRIRLSRTLSHSEPAEWFEVPWNNVRTVFTQTWRAGLYQIEDARGATAADIEPRMFIVSPSPSESQIGSLNRDELEALAQKLGATLINSAEDYFDSEQIRRNGQEIWRPLLAAVLVLLFLELFVQQRLTRGAT